MPAMRKARSPRKAKAKMPEPDTDEYVTIKVTRELGLTKLIVDAKGLHDYLKALGAMTDEGALNAPWSARLNTSAHRLDTGAILANPKKGSTYTWDIGATYGKPMNHTVLQSLVDSVAPAVAEIIEFYRPVEMVARVVGKAK